jgi:2-oxoisovalerate dehydrogenase E1 component
VTPRLRRRAGASPRTAAPGATLCRANAAAKRFEEEFGISVELIDGRSLVPFNIEKVVESVKKTGRIMLCSDACEVASFLHTVASRLSQAAFDSLDAPPVIIGARNWIVPPAELEEFYYPQVEWILDAYHTNIKPLPGYTPSTTLSPEEILLNGKYGIVG